jgi:outer membrane protein assembly factor BamD (BamD/ComL family)
MIKFGILLLVIAVSICGCAGIQKKREITVSPSRNLESAKKLLRENKVSAATNVLESICSAKGVPGVTDEALFRLGLLYLDAGQGKSEITQAQQILERLIKEYPSSSWRNHAASLIELIATLNRRIRYLKGENLSLSKENRELRLNIEKLKIIDIEQDLKGKR